METLIKILIGLIILGVIAIDPILVYTTSTNAEFTVKDKTTVVSQGHSKYLIYTDNEVYEDTDSVWYFKFNSSDVYSQIEVGKHYNAKVYGLRVPFLSWYKNIVSVQ